MAKSYRKGSKTAALPPGTLVHVGRQRIEQVRITVLDYNEEQLEEFQIENVEECFPFRDKPTVTWINVDGIHDVEVIEKLGAHFDFHPLLLEDVLNTEQRPKIEDYESHLFLVVKMLYFEGDSSKLEAEQVSLVLGPNFVVSFQERPGDVFEAIRERIRTARGRIRKAGADYLAYSLDAIVDNYFAILEALGERIQAVQENLVARPNPRTLEAIQGLKREMVQLRKSVWPLREVISGWQRTETPLLKKPTEIYLRDVYDHTIQVVDTAETFRDSLSGMVDLYLSSVSNRMNEVMKVLTIIATIFIPLTFIAGIYGMNFQYMPELHWRWGYPLVLLIMCSLAVGMLFYFRRRKWL